MLVYDRDNRQHRERAAMAIKSRWAIELSRVTNGASGEADPEIAQQVAAKFAQQWAEAGLDPADPSAPRAPAGVQPLPEPEVVAPQPESYSGPSSAELEQAIEAERKNLTSMDRIYALRAQHAEAKRHGA